MRSPTQARLRLVDDMYGASSVVSSNNQASPNWKPSLGGGGYQDGDKKKRAALENKMYLEQQILDTKRRKETELRAEKEKDERILERHRMERENEKQRNDHHNEMQREKASLEKLRQQTREEAMNREKAKL